MSNDVRKDERERLEQEHERAVEAREGSVLGIAGSDVPQSPDDVHATDDPEEVRRRRARALAGSDSGAASGGAIPGGSSGHGATSIDMGDGGDGTDIAPPSSVRGSR